MTPKSEDAAEGDQCERDLGGANVRRRQIERTLISPAAATTMITPSAALGNGLISGIAKRRKNPTTDRGDDHGGLRPRAGGVVDGGARVRGGDGERARQAADDVRAAERGQFAVGVGVVAVPLRERPHRRDQVGERDERERGRRKQQIEEIVQADVGHPKGGRPPWTSPTIAMSWLGRSRARQSGGRRRAPQGTGVSPEEARLR